MKKLAEVSENIVTNIITWPVDVDVPPTLIDITGLFCDMGSLIVSGEIKNKPSSMHTVNADNTGWELTPENKAQADEEDNDKTHGVIVHELSDIDAKSIRSMREFIISKFSGDPDLPEYLGNYEAEAIDKRDKIKTIMPV